MYRKGNFTIHVAEDYHAMSKKAAEVVAGAINANPNGVFGFATGSTPVGTYEELIQMYKNGKVDFSGMTTFNLDEYYPIQKDNDQSYHYFMMNNLFNHVNIKKDRINLPNGEAADAEKECVAYEEKIKKAGGIHLQILGIGLNGHIAFNEPSDVFPAATHLVTLDDSTIAANARFFESADLVPRKALSMGIGSIMAAEKILLLVNKEGKKDIIEKTIFGEITPKVPASVLQLHRDVTVILDKSAAENVLIRLA